MQQRPKIRRRDFERGTYLFRRQIVQEPKGKDRSQAFREIASALLEKTLEFRSFAKRRGVAAPSPGGLGPMSAAVELRIEPGIAVRQVGAQLNAVVSAKPVDRLPLENRRQPRAHRRSSREFIQPFESGEQRFLDEVLGNIPSSDSGKRKPKKVVAVIRQPTTGICFGGDRKCVAHSTPSKQARPEENPGEPHRNARQWPE